MKERNLFVATVVASCIVLSGCSAMGTAIKKRNLDVKTQMSQTVWLEPSSEKTVYLQVRNTSDKDMSDLQTLLAQDLRAKGYTVTSSPDTAYYWIQANVLKAEKMDLRQSQGFLSTGYEGAAAGAALGAGITAYNSNSGGAILGVGLAAGLAGNRLRYLRRVRGCHRSTGCVVFRTKKPVMKTKGTAKRVRRPPRRRAKPIRWI